MRIPDTVEMARDHKTVGRTDLAHLAGLKVIDMGSALAAPYSATLLGDLGAEVIKIEKPRRGDLIRFTDDYIGGESGYFIGINRGKDSVTVDVRKPEGQDIIRKLLADADVLVENFRPHRMKSWGLGYEEVAAINPRLIYCSVSAFGDAAGFEETGGNDIVAQGFSGLMDLTGDPGSAPSRTGSPVVDVSGGFLSTVGILAALLKRAQTGVGEHIQVSLLEGAYSLMPNYIASVLNGSPDFKRLGSGHPQLAPYRAFKAGDGKYLVVGAFHRSSWQALCKAIEREDLISDPRFVENKDRVDNRLALDEVLQQELGTRTRDAWLAIFTRDEVISSPVLTINESLEEFGKAIPGLVVSQDHGSLGALKMLRSPIRFSSESHVPKRAAPTLGQDTVARLTELGFSHAELDDLRDRRII